MPLALMDDLAVPETDLDLRKDGEGDPDKKSPSRSLFDVSASAVLGLVGTSVGVIASGSGVFCDSVC